MLESMALVTVALTQKDRKAYAKSVLINTLNVCDFKADGTSTIFWYEWIDDMKYPSIECKTSYGKGTFHALIRQATNERWFNIQVLTEGAEHERKKAVNAVWKVDTNRILWAEDNAAGTGCTIWYKRSPFKVVKLTTSHTIADLNRGESQSASLSES